MVVGWYHSHPGFGCWLSGVDINTQQSFEALNQRAVAVVIDPIQSVKGKVVIDAFRLINPQVGLLLARVGCRVALWNFTPFACELRNSFQ
jgi:26S proteasome regulatory subunit N11